MAAVDYVLLGDVVRNFQFQILSLPYSTSIPLLLDDWLTDHPLVAAIELTEDDRNEVLKSLTGCVVATGTDLSCYPVGRETAILFDANGDPVT